MIKQRKREELYDLFRQGANPSGADFADFIKSQLNLLDDGIAISENAADPIGFRGHGEAENYLDLYDSSGDLRWRISGKDEAVTAEGLNFTVDSQSRLFVERDSGHVGVGTDGPKAKLHIIQTSATDALRIDDAGSDTTPLVVTSEGQVGLGTVSPGAKLHLSYSGSGAIVRVDDTDSDTTPFIIGETGNVGIGYSDPQAKLAVAGGLTVGSNQNPGSNNLYVAGNIEVAGTVVFSNGSGIGGIEINAPLTSKTTEITLLDNVTISGDADQDGSNGNLNVAGDTTLGTYQKVYENQNVLTVNGRIRSGGDLKSGVEQYELELNEVLVVDRTPNKEQLAVTGKMTVSDTIFTRKLMIDGLAAATANMAPPVGAIIAWLPGLYSNSAQTGFQVKSITLPENWRLCDGSAIKDNPWLGSGYLPSLSDSRFLMGVTDPGKLGNQSGTNDGWAHTHNYTDPFVPAHKHGKGSLTTAESGSHTHNWFHGYEQDDKGRGGSHDEFTFTGGMLTNVMSAAGAHTHAISGEVGNAAGVSGDRAFQAAGGSVNGVRESLIGVNLPKYLALYYIMRVV